MGHAVCQLAEADPAEASAIAPGRDPAVGECGHLAREVAPVPCSVRDVGTDATAGAGAPAFRCGRCLAKIQRSLSGHTIRCGSCGGRVLIPAHVHLSCRRCGHRHRMRPSELNTEHLCPVCARPLAVKDVVLPPARCHHRKRPRARPVRREPHDRAVSTMLLVGLTLIAATMLLIQL